MAMMVNKPAALAFVTVWACGIPEPDIDEPDQVDDARLVLSDGARVQYIGAFSWDGAVAVDGGYEFTNDEGYDFRIERLNMATSSAQLRPCASPSSARWRWATNVAHADHVAENDSSMAITSSNEDALASTWHHLGIGEASAKSYCGAFFASNSLSTPDAILGDNTIIVAGSYRAPGQADWVAFDARIPLGDGALLQLYAGTPAIGTFESPEGVDLAARVVYTRYPVAAFRGVQPDRVSTSQLAWEVLGGLLHTSAANYQRHADFAAH